MIYLTIVSLVWALSFGLIGSTLKGLDALQVADARLLLAMLIFLPFLRPRKISCWEKLQLIGIGAVQFGVMYVCYLSAFRFLPSHLVALFTVLTPVYIVLIHDLLRQRFTPLYFLAAALSVAGAAIIKAKTNNATEIWLGFWMMQIANLAFAFGQVFYREWKLARPQIKDSEVFAFLYIGGAFFAAIAILLLTQEPPLPLEASSTQWGVIIYLGLVASGGGFFLWNQGGTKVTAGVLAVFNNALVPLAMLVSLFVFGEIEGATVEELMRLALGSMLIMAALLLGKRKRQASD